MTTPPLPPDLETWLRTVLDAADLPFPDREDVARELRAHFEDALAAGRTPNELLRHFGEPREAARRIRAARIEGPDARSRRWRTHLATSLAEIARGIARAGRTLLREPAFGAVVILTLALGVGANTAVFTVLDAVLLEPLPYPASDRLVRVYDVWMEQPDALNDYLRAPVVSAMEDWDEVFEDVTTLYTYREIGADLTSSGTPERLVVSRVGWNYFRTLGVSPALGRSFTRDESYTAFEFDGNYDGAPVVILGSPLWRRLFGGDRDVVGRTLELDGITHEVIGVLPEHFEDPMGSRADLWIPADLSPGGSNNWGNHYLTGLARLRPGLSVSAAQDRVEALASRLSEAHAENAGWSLALRPLHEDLVGERRAKLLWILAAAVGLILLSACVNVANLVFARSLGRERDVALRAALGSARPRLFAHLLSESMVLAVAGGAAGLLLGTLGVRGLLALAPDALPTIATPELSPRVLGAAMASAMGALLLFGLAPALRLSRLPPAEVLRAGGRSGTEGRRLRRLRAGLVVAQVAVAVVLVSGAVLLQRSFVQLQKVDLGIDDTGVWTAEVHLPDTRYPDGGSRHRFHRRFLGALSELPGVEAAGATSWLPVNGHYHWWGFYWVDGWDGAAERGEGPWIGTDVRVIAGDYFDAVGLEVVRGREWSEPAPEDPRVIWVNETLARDPALGGADLLGQLIQVANEPRRVVGIVEDAPHDPQGSLSAKTYVPHAQFSDNRNWALIQTVRVRPGTSPGELRESMRSVLSGIDGQLVLYRSRPLSALLDAARAQERFAALLMTTFAVLALCLSLVGSYGVMAGTVARRRREIGIRMALGAEPGRVRRTVLGSAVRLTSLGIGLGLTLAWFGSRWLELLLFDVGREDPLVYGAVGIGILVTGTVVGWLPARRATRVDPASALAAE